jgi:SLT domain-containing protein
MKLSAQLLASLATTLAMLGQSTIARPLDHLPLKNIIAINQSKHKIGFVKISKSELNQTGTCGYSLFGSKNQDNVVLVTGVGEKPLINIDGENIALESISKKEIRRKSQFIGSNNVYKSGKFTIDTNFRDVTTAKDRKNFGARQRGSIIIVSNNGWRKKLEVECAYDVGG